MVVYNDELYHYGVKGMRWGRRKIKREPVSDIRHKGVVVKQNGEISIQKGCSLQRLVSDRSRELKGITYASFLDYDNAKYVKYIGGKGLFGGGRDRIISLKAKEPLKSPSKKEATKLMIDLLDNDRDFKKYLTDPFGNVVPDSIIKKMKKDPDGPIAETWYTTLNIAMTFTDDFDPKASKMQSIYKKSLQKKGYNMLRDENDYQNKVSIAPVIILDPEKTLSVVSQSDITDELRRKSKETVKRYKSMGREWAERYLYEN